MNQTHTTDKSTAVVRFPVYEFLILFVPVAILVLLVGFSFASLRTDNRIEGVLDDDETRLQHISGFVGAQLSVSLNHLLAVAGEDTTLSAITTPSAGNLRALERSLLTLAGRNPFYDQVRWIDGSGRERVRVSRRGEGPHIEPAEALQRKSHRYYFAATRELLPGEVYVSPVDLNVEHGEVERPYKPVLRVATPALDRSRQGHGILVINLTMHRVFDAINNLQQRNLTARYLLINGDGQVLNHPDSGAADQSFTTEHDRIWQRIKASPTGSMEAESGLWTWSVHAPDDVLRSMRTAYPENAAAVDQVISEDFGLILVAHRPVSFLLDLRRDSRMLVSLATLLVLAVYGLSMYLYLSGHVRERRAQLHAGYAVARAENSERVKRLEARFHRLFEASNIGQLVVDGGGRIEIGNPAAARLLGYEVGQLKGLPVENLLPESKREQHKQLRTGYMEAPEARRMGEGRELEARRRDGSLIPVEIGLNPYQDEDRQLVLVSIIDLSQRR